MTRPAMAGSRSSFGVMGWLRVTARLGLLLGLLATCVSGHAIGQALGRRKIWPRRFLAASGRICGLRIAIRGRPHHRALFLSNHVSWLDVPALAGVTGTAFVAHDGLAGMPLLRQLCSLNDTVFIARHRRATVHHQAHRVRTALDELGSLALFPEGTTSDGHGLIPFKSALLSAVEPLPPGITVQPVLLDYAEAPRIAWAGTEHGLSNFLRITARRRPIRLTIHFLQPLTGAGLAGRKAMAAAAQAAIAAAPGSIPLHPDAELP